MKKICLIPFIHQRQQCIAMHFENSDLLNNLVRDYIPLYRKTYENLLSACKGNAQPDNSLLKKYLLGRKKANQATSITPAFSEKSFALYQRKCRHDEANRVSFITAQLCHAYA